MDESRSDIDIDKFTMHPNWLFKANISANAHLVYVVLLSYDWSGKREAWPSVPTIAAMAKVGASTAYRALRELEEVGLISIEPRFVDVDRRQRKSNLYYLNELSKKEIGWLCRRPTTATAGILAPRKPPVTAGEPPVRAGDTPVTATDPPVDVTAETDKLELHEREADEVKPDDKDPDESHTHAFGVRERVSQGESQEQSQERVGKPGESMACTKETTTLISEAKYPRLNDKSDDFGSLRERLRKNR